MVTELHLNNGVPMPALGFGVFQSPPEQTTAAVAAALQTIPKSVRPSRIAENFAVLDFELTADEVASLNALDTGVRLGPDPDVDRPERFSIEIPTA